MWSRRQPLTSVGAVLSLLDGPTGCDPLFCVVWFRFRLFHRFLALWPSQVGRAYRLLVILFIFFWLVLLRLVYGVDPLALAWARPGLPLLCNLAGPVQHFKAATL